MADPREPFYDETTVMSDFHLHEKTVLLALRERKGTPVPGSFALGGACLAALCLCGRLGIVPGRKGLIEVVDRMPTGEAVLDDCLERVVRARRQSHAVHWVKRFNAGDTYHRTASGLCRRGILRADNVRAWLLFTRRVHRIIDSEPRRRLIDLLSEGVFGDPAPVDPETMILTALADAGGILRVHFARKQLRNRRRHLRELAARNVVGDTVSRAVREAQRAAASTTGAAG